MSKGEQTREAILDRALDMAGVLGVDGMSIGGLASETGLSKSGLFAHFGSKEALQLAVLAASSERYLDRVIRPTARIASPLDRLERIFDNMLDWAKGTGSAGGCVFLTAAAEFDDRPGPVRDYVALMQSTMLELLSRYAARAVRAGDLRADLDTEQFAFDVFSIYIGYHLAYRLMRDPKAEDHARAAFARVLANSR